MTEPSLPTSGFKQTTGADNAETIADALATHTPCKAAYIGVAGSYDFYLGDEWVAFVGLLAGSILPVRAQGARHTSGSSAPDANDIVFLY